MTIATIVAIIVLIVVFVKVVDATAGVENNYQNQDFGK